MRLLFVGGGSGGPVAPLLAVANHIKQNHTTAEFLFVGTEHGPEQQMVKESGFKFVFISTAKLRRYFSWHNLIMPFKFVFAFFDAQKVLKEFKPDCVFGTGSFVQVPVVWAAWLRKIPVVLHQQDIMPSLANKLCQFNAKKITVTFELNLTSFL